MKEQSIYSKIIYLLDKNSSFTLRPPPPPPAPQLQSNLYPNPMNYQTSGQQQYYQAPP
ncbi:unnamed protein product, partial [Rotaria socialis]